MNKKLSIQNESKTYVAKMTKESFASFHKIDKCFKRTKANKHKPAKVKMDKLLSK